MFTDIHSPVRETKHSRIVPKSIDNYANYNARLRLSGHGTNSGQ